MGALAAAAAIPPLLPPSEKVNVAAASPGSRPPPPAPLHRRQRSHACRVRESQAACLFSSCFFFQGVAHPVAASPVGHASSWFPPRGGAPLGCGCHSATERPGSSRIPSVVGCVCWARKGWGGAPSRGGGAGPPAGSTVVTAEYRKYASWRTRGSHRGAAAHPRLATHPCQRASGLVRTGNNVEGGRRAAAVGPSPADEAEVVWHAATLAADDRAGCPGWELPERSPPPPELLPWPSPPPHEHYMN